MDKTITANQTLAAILKQALTPEQIEQLLEIIYNIPVYGACPLCGSEDIPVDRDGEPIPENATLEQWSNARWRSTHEEDCIVSWMQKDEAVQAAESEVRNDA